jgi:hypothetical protein
VRQISFMKIHFICSRQPLGKYERHPLNPNWGGGSSFWPSLSPTLCNKQGFVGASSEGCTSPITSKYQILLLLFCEILQQKDTQERYQRTQESYNASLGRWESYTREGSKNSKVTQCTCWVVGFNIFEARALKTSFGKSQMGVVAVARKGCVFWVIL